MKLLVVVAEVLVESLLPRIILELMLLILEWLLEAASRLRPTTHLLLHLLGSFPTSLSLLPREEFTAIVSVIWERLVIIKAAFILILVKILALINLVIGFTLQLLLLLLNCGLL